MTMVTLMSGCAEQRARSELVALQQEVEASELDGQDLATEFKARYEALVQENAGTEAALTAKLWLLQQTWWEQEAGTTQESAGRIIDEILADYADSPQLDQIPDYAYVLSTDQREQCFNHLIELSQHETVQAAAIYGLAEMNLYDGDEESQEKATGYLRELLDNYADVPSKYTTFGAVADAALNPLDPADLEIGKPAPEIIGTSYDGKPMKLSDYRGKVVVIDFWGDW